MDQSITYNLTKPSILLMNNVYLSWLQTIYLKVPKNVTMFTRRTFYDSNKHTSFPVAFLDSNIKQYNETTLLKQNHNNLIPNDAGCLNVQIMVPQHDSLQYFIQWQRYRKYWWSSITTTPSLFVVDEVNYEHDTTHANITAKFPWGQHKVETITLSTKEAINSVSTITCSTSLEIALYIILQDGLCNSTKEEYLRLHRNMAPFKIAFVLDYEDAVNKKRLCELAKLIYSKLHKRNISSFLPNFTLTAKQQIMENLRLGVTYVAILCDSTLNNGIIQLLNSSTMLKEQVHLADLESYASILCK
ncbi:unnamed protein product [Chilo suppressalis]|uniref:DNA polymerase subunit gamma-2, mitochondrial n=1 Tax=Chilo suppressalis TaxID=168631 RepID=A0ABN8AXI1_CHISP|nr:hypothetical protein evm_010129 [Chilo suppressalis]CAH0397928.1 unnamed protein product [Chilo suppressalis]